MSKPTIITFVRHGDRPPTPEGMPRFPGVSLSAKGRKQAAAVGKLLADFPYDVILCSDMARAKETAEHIAAHQRKKPSFREELREFNKVVFEGLPKDASKEYLIKYHREVASAKLAAAFIKDVVRKHAGKRILIIGHGNNMRGGIGALLGFDMREAPFMALDPCSVTTISIVDGKAGILHLNITADRRLPGLDRIGYEE